MRKLEGAGTGDLLFSFPLLARIICSLGIFLFIASCAARERYPGAGYAVASWYGPEFHGRPTSSGDIFDMYKFTCAHREYPFGTRLKVTNISNNKSVECLVNDRGPFVSGRDVDLSYAAAKEIGLTGIGKVKIERIGRDDAYIKTVKYLPAAGPFTIQIGSFNELANALHLKAILDMKYRGSYISTVEVNGSRFYRVRIGKFRMNEEVSAVASSLAAEGYNVFITEYDEQGR
jgi:rare lipoprotein A